MDRRKRFSYEASFKLKVVLRAEEANNMVAAREFGVNEKSVREWRKLKGVLKKSKKTAKSARGKAAQFPDLDKAVLTWVLESRQNGHIVTRTAIRLKALHLAKTVMKNHPGESSASAGWCSRFMERYGLSLRQRTKIAQKLPKQLEEKIVAFQKEVINLRKENNFELSQIGNMDETPMTFDIPINRTVNAKGDKTVLIKTTGHEKTHFTVVLTCMADGTKLKPVVIFKRKRLPKNVKFAARVIVRPQAKGWMDEDGVVDWISKVWDQRPGAALGKKSLLVWDSFRAHLTDKVKEKVKESRRTSQVVIPGGLTSILQPLDVCIKKPFKDRMKKKWMSSEDVQTTKRGNLKKVDIVTIVQWVKDAWDSIPAAMISKSLKKCCISKAMDGTEDDISDSKIDTDAGSDDDEEEEMHCADHISEVAWRELFGDSSEDESDFDGF
ncbi:hypothetical protein JTE90_021505 [Oedothorax gibbosus]|uniref:HTH CENPB-type domain-containing protein n=1 Tax=Oedothorax gibbosus TaxID=931172 RepID=A0AAV6VQ96_9ARAC|nr:hypothetical protein JTE90_021505 [Oedothorax gibbosus]